MKKNRHISTLAELQLEISKVKTECDQKGEQLQRDLLSFLDRLSLVSIISKAFNTKNLFKLDEKTNLSGNILAFALPYLLNKTFLRKSNLLTKGIVSLLSGKFAQSFDMERITQLFNQVKTFFADKKKSTTVQFKDYGIPPDSETY